MPAELSSFVGRDNDVAEVRRLFACARLLTLTGPGGIGKTRLALRVARELLSEIRDGVWLVELAPLGDPDLVGRAVAAALEVREQAGEPLTATLSKVLVDRDLLIVLDNCEHLVESCAEVAFTLLQRCPGLKILASSREPLGVPGEIAWQLPSLTLPTDEQSSTAGSRPESEAVMLFVDRARSVLPHFVLTDDNA